MGLFKKPDIKEQVRGWRSQIRHESRSIEREIAKIQREADAQKKQIKQYALQGNNAAAKTLVTELLRTNKAIERMYMARAQLNSIDQQMATNLATIRMGSSLELSASVMQSMNDLIKMPQIQQSMKQLYKEMSKAGYVEDMMDSTLNDALGSADEEELADEELNKVLDEITRGQFSNVSVSSSKLNNKQVVSQEEELEERFNKLKT